MKYTTRLFSLAIAAAICLSTTLSRAATIAQWTFESQSTGFNATANTLSPAVPIAPETGTGGLQLLNANAAVVTFPVGNGTAHCMNIANWTGPTTPPVTASGNYWLFQTSTTGSSGIGLEWDQRGSNTGPKDFELQYSTNGTTFTDFSAITVQNVAWALATPTTLTHFTADLSGVAALNNAATVFFRLAQTSTNAVSGTLGTAGTDAIDNFTVATVPEPSTLVLCGLGLVGLVGVARRRK